MTNNHYPASISRHTDRKIHVLHANGSDGVGGLIDNAVANLNQKQVQVLSAKAANEALRLEVKMREQNLDFVAARRAIDDHNDVFAILDKSGKLTRQKVVSSINTGAGNMRIESKAGATCFVASAAYEDPNHPDVMFLRWIRDQHLRYNPTGRAFIDWYWRVGPRLAVVVSRHEWLRRLSKAGLHLLVGALRCGFRLRSLR